MLTDSVLRHPAIVECLGANIEEIEPFMVTELMLGDLFTLLDRGIPPIARLLLSEKIRIAMEICDAVHFLHQNGIIHRDLKSLNVLIAENKTAKLVDFGTSRVIDKSSTMTGAVGTARW
jgi:serine/threonine protein kinase